ncbi:hypothetical protein TSUD_279890 [Trifolium subterraneum]|uniref:F-box associated beta-propeller type 1 domain-containing protein n=1 Tax=Trifolium subterraneum TaxID=3900 RepID=A0A2Z6MPF3_TRISU|nr:hypothetical protein TSUD_279890 [Trifolium subterraneum]
MELETKNHMVMQYLPHELIIQILLRLPVKSLIRFKCVSFYIWNPSTGVHKQIPLSPNLDSDEEYFYGFGYDQSTDDYCIVLMSTDSNTSYLEFFSLRANTWKQIEGTHIHYLNPIEDDPKFGLFFNGATHWFAYCLDLQNDVILVLDLMERKLLDIHLPDEFDLQLDNCGLWVFQEFLSLWAKNYDNDTVEIWVMKEYKLHSSWTKTHVLPTGAIPTKNFSPLRSTKSGDIVGTDDHTGLVKYTDEGQLLGHQSYGNNPYGFQVAIFTESLLSLPGDNEQA